jgi:hypothetical protein
MITKKILFITGAGASYDFGFPTGQGLINQIINEKWISIGEAKLGIDLLEKDFDDFKNKLRWSNTPSIDIFIANNPEYADFSKSLIAKIIGEREQKAMEKLFDESWLKYIWFKMIEGCLNIEDFLNNNNAKFLTFNYDRMLEFFFSMSTMNFFNKETSGMNSVKIFETIPIVHVFGKVGNLPWEDSVKYRLYKDTPGEYLTWEEVGKELRTIYETKENERHEEIIEMINDSDEIYFLGFGYNTFNLELLDIDNWADKKYISGSRYEISRSELKDINFLHKGKFDNLTIYEHFKCYDFLKNDVLFFANGNSNNQ